MKTEIFNIISKMINSNIPFVIISGNDVLFTGF